MNGFSRVGVTQGGVLDSEDQPQIKAKRDFTNDRDYFSPASAFNHTDPDTGVTTGKGAVFFLAPFIPVGNNDSSYAKQIDPVGIFLYATNLILTFFGAFGYCFGLLAVVYMLGNDGTNVGIASMIIALTSAAMWATFAGYWPYDDRIKHHLNPIISLCRLATSDQGLVSVVVTIGFLLLAAFAAGKSIGDLGWDAWGASPANVLPRNNISKMAFGLSWFLALFIALTYTFCEKFEQAFAPEHRNWSRTVAGTTLVIFWATLVGNQAGFTYVGNPMLSFAAYSAHGGWTTVSFAGLRDSVYFLCIEMLTVPIAVLILYAVVRFGIYLDERAGAGRIRYIPRYPKTNYTANESSIQGRPAPRMSSGLKKRRQ